MEDREEQITKRIEEIQRLAATDKNIDAPALIESLLSQAKEPGLSVKEKTRAYMVSLLLPPFGLYYVVKFFIRGEQSARRAAWTCIILTVLSLGITAWLGYAVLSQTPNLGELQGVSPQNLQDLNDLLGQ